VQQENLRELRKFLFDELLQLQVEEATLKEKLRGSETNRRKKAKVGPEKGNDAGGDSLQHCSQQR
jgi:hypothetical protein